MSQKHENKCENLADELKQYSADSNQPSSLRKEENDTQTGEKGYVPTVDSSTVCSSLSQLRLSAIKDSAPQEIAATETAPKSNSTSQSQPPSLLEQALQREAKKILKHNVRELHCGNVRRELDALYFFQGKCFSGDQPGIEAVMKADNVRRLIHFLKREDDINLPFRSAEVLRHFMKESSKEQTEIFVDAGAVEALINLLRPKKDFIDVTNTAMIVLEQIVRKDPVLRNFVLNRDIVPRLVNLVPFTTTLSSIIETMFGPTSPENFLVKIAEVMSHLCGGGEPYPPKDKTILILPAASKMMLMSDHVHISMRVCCILSDLSSPSRGLREETSEEIYKSGLAKKLVEVFNSGNEMIIEYGLIAVLNFVGSSELRAQHFIDVEGLPCLAKLLQSDNVEIVHYTAGIVRNIIANRCPIQVANAGIAPLLDGVIKRDMLEAVENAVFALVYLYNDCRDNDSLIYLCESKTVQAMCALLKCKDVDVEISNVLWAIAYTLLGAGTIGKIENVTLEVKKCGVLGLIKGFRNHTDKLIRRYACDIIDIYFPE